MPGAASPPIAELRAARDVALQKLADLSAKQWEIFRATLADIERSEIERIKASLHSPAA